MKNERESDMERDRRAPRVRILAQTHQRDLERGRICGCPQCLADAGLERVEVFDHATGNYKMMLVNWFSKTARTADKGTHQDAPNAPVPRAFFRSSQERVEEQE